MFENDEFLQALSHSIDSCRDPLVLEGEEEDDDDVWLKALEGVERDASFSQGSVISEAYTLVCGTAIQSHSGGESIEEQLEKGDVGSCELPCPAARADPRDLLMTEEEMSLFLCE